MHDPSLRGEKPALETKKNQAAVKGQRITAWGLVMRVSVGFSGKAQERHEETQRPRRRLTFAVETGEVNGAAVGPGIGRTRSDAVRVGTEVSVHRVGLFRLR